ncbi:gap junction protein alpha 4 [Hoplias malabaricus]|uniref:gap junction protein alpha 4 n=1 Tax=Hoplias malabaricus TaxID=27720 RepID=UPI0034620B2E
MSRADWGFLEHLLVDGQEYSTNVGRVWLTVLFIFRMLVLGTAAESAWDDEQSDFVCNTLQPGCMAVCYDKAFPISHFRYFILQVVFVSTPTIFYFGYVALKTREDQKGEKEEVEAQCKRHKDCREKHGKLEVIEEEDEEDEKQMGKKKKKAETPKIKGRILGAYAISIALKVVLEVGFIAGLWFLYGFIIPAKYECKRDPCPQIVDCFVSRPTEKTIFTIYTQAIAAISAFLNIVELFYLLKLAITHYLTKKYKCHVFGTQIERTPTKLELTELPAPYERGHIFLPVGSNNYSQSGHGWSESEPYLSEDTLPTYSNCISNNNQRSHSKHHSHSKKHSTNVHKGKHSKDKQYV